MAVRNWAKAHPAAPVPRRREFVGDPALVPMPRKRDAGSFEPLPSSRYHREGYDKRVEEQKKVRHAHGK